MINDFCVIWNWSKNRQIKLSLNTICGVLIWLELFLVAVSIWPNQSASQSDTQIFDTKNKPHTLKTMPNKHYDQTESGATISTT